MRDAAALMGRGEALMQDAETLSGGAREALGASSARRAGRRSRRRASRSRPTTRATEVARLRERMNRVVEIASTQSRGRRAWWPRRPGRPGGRAARDGGGDDEPQAGRERARRPHPSHHERPMTERPLEMPDWAQVGEKRRAHIGRVTALLDRWADVQLHLDAAEAQAWHDVGRFHDALRDAPEAELRRLAAGHDLPLEVLHGPAAANHLESHSANVA
jgi:hypothetical protein